MSTPISSDPWGGACTGCGATLAADQRYCLACGTRRDGARLPFRDALSTPGQRSLPVPATVQQSAAGGPPAYGPTGASPTLLTSLAALACVLLAFGVGVLVGDGGGDDGPTQVAAAPAAAQAAPVAATTTDTSAAAAADAAKAKDDKKDEEASADDEVSATPTKPKAAPKKVVAQSKKAIQGLEQAKTPKQYAEQSAKLPDVVVTGGGK